MTIIGLIGNPIVIYILTKPKFRKIPIFRYFLATELVDVFSLFFLWIWYLPTYFKWQTPVIFCKVMNFTFFITYDFYPWISVLNSIDRLLCVKYPNKFKFRLKLKYQLLALSCIIVTLFFVNIPYFYYANYFLQANQTVCGIESNYIAFYASISSVSISNIIPFILMTISTLVISHHLIAHKKRLLQNKANFKKELAFVKSIVIMDIWLFLCFLPLNVVNFTKLVYSLNGTVDEFWQLLHDLTIFLIVLQTCCNFFVYILCNKLFRNYFISMFSCCRKTVVSSI